MSVGLKPAQNLLPVPGIKLAACCAGIYKNGRDDIALINFADNSSISASFTKNKFAAAPVIVARNHLNKTTGHSYCLINAGNANAGLGEQGIKDALATCVNLTKYVNCSKESILPFSTGVIGLNLPVEKINKSVPELINGLKEDNWTKCVGAIMTTDTVMKGISKQIMLDGKLVTITGIAKGSGMIRPDMATMLAFIGTDAAVEKKVLDIILDESITRSFNRICVDGDMSTNDACVLIATGKSGNKLISKNSGDDYRNLEKAITDLCIFLAQAIVRDGEGASKFVTIEINGGGSELESLKVANSIAQSPLVKTAFFASDPNWGRILSAIGYTEIENLDVSGVNIFINGTCIVKNGSRAEDYTEESGIKAMASDEIIVRVELGRGDCQQTVWTCDLSHEYVRINAEYRS